mgnify:CR=1 FL=1
MAVKICFGLLFTAFAFKMPHFAGSSGGAAGGLIDNIIRAKLRKTASEGKQKLDDVFGEKKNKNPESLLRNMLMMQNPSTQI